MSWSFPRAEALPPYAFVRTDAVKERVLAAGADLIDLGLGNPDRPTPAEIVAQLHVAADIGKNHRYFPGRGLITLREAAARWYERRYNVRFDVERELIVTMGAKEGMSHFCMAMLDRGDVAVSPDPAYPIHVGAPLIAGADVELYPARADLPAGRAVAQAIERLKAQGRRPKLVIANYPQTRRASSSRARSSKICSPSCATRALSCSTIWPTPTSISTPATRPASSTAACPRPR